MMDSFGAIKHEDQMPSNARFTQPERSEDCEELYPADWVTHGNLIRSYHFVETSLTGYTLVHGSSQLEEIARNFGVDKRNIAVQ